MRISDRSSDVCSSDLGLHAGAVGKHREGFQRDRAGFVQHVARDLLQALAQRFVAQQDFDAQFLRGGGRGLGFGHAAILLAAIPPRGAGGRMEYRLPFWKFYYTIETKRSEARRVGEGCVGTCRSRWSTHN